MDEDRIHTKVPDAGTVRLMLDFPSASDAAAWVQATFGEAAKAWRMDGLDQRVHHPDRTFLVKGVGDHRMAGTDLASLIRP